VWGGGSRLVVFGVVGVLGGVGGGGGGGGGSIASMEFLRAELYWNRV